MRNFIGVDLGGTNIRAAIVSEDGTIKCMKKSESHPERGAEAVMETMISLIESLDDHFRIRTDKGNLALFAKFCKFCIFR